MGNVKSIILSAPLLVQSGYSVHSRQVAKWLLKLEKERSDIQVTFDVVPWGMCPSYVDPDACDGLIGEILQRTQKKDLYDISIQLKLPNEWNPFMANYNIGMTAGVETDICNPLWVDSVNKMDMVIVPSEFTKNTFLASGNVTTPIHVIAESWLPAVAQSVSEGRVNKLVDKLPLETDFNFLMVSQFTGNNPENDRKNIAYTLKWMLEHFSNDPKVGLILKTNFGRQTPLDRRNVLQIVSQIVAECKKGPGPKIHVLHGHMNDEEMVDLYTHPKVKALINLSAGEGFCGLDYTPIVTKNGIKRLDEVTTKDFVLTHKNRFRKVTQLLCRDYDGEMIKITPFLSANKNKPITLTPNHRVYVYDSNNNEFIWKSSGELCKNDILCLPKADKENTTLLNVNIFDTIKNIDNIEMKINSINEEVIYYKQSNKLGDIIKNKLNINASFGKLVGYYLSEGCASVDGEMSFSLHKKEKETLAKDIINCFKEVFGFERYRIEENDVNNKLIVHFHNKIISNFFITLFGQGAKNKSIPGNFMYKTSNDFRTGLLSGLFAGDGYISNENESYSIQLCNEKLIKQTRLLLLQQGISCSYTQSRRVGIILNKWKYDGIYTKINITGNKNQIELSKLFEKHLSWFENNIKIKNIDTQRKSFFENDFLLLKIKNLEAINHTGKVYNLSVDEDESYCTEDFMVHNCLPALEAAACGLPVITTNWSAPLEFLGKGKFIKVDCTLQQIHPSRVDNQIFMPNAKWARVHEDDFKRKVKRFRDSPAIPMQWAKELQQKLLMEYSPEAVQKQYSELLKEVLDKP